MNNKKDRIIRKYSRELRTNMTRTEKHLWYDFLKLLPYTVRRQVPITDYIVDFYIPCAKIVIEIDGESHYENNNQECDKIRDKILSDFGLSVLRYLNSEIDSNFDGVCKDILLKINDRINYER